MTVAVRALTQLLTQESPMSSIVNKIRPQRYKRIALGTLAAIVILALSFCVWVYNAKTQRDLNMQLLGAVRKGNAEAARSLLKRGADPNIRDVPQQQLSLWQQIRHAFHKDSPSLARQAKIYTPTPLEIVLERKHLGQLRHISVEPSENAPLVKALLEAGARPDDSWDSHVTPLMDAVSYNQLQTVQLLLDHGANPGARDGNGRLPLHYISGFGPDNLMIVEVLLRRGNDVNSADDDGQTPLMQAVGNAGDEDAIKLVRFLAAKGANVNALSKDGSSALLQAAASGKTEIIRFLLEQGAEVNVHDKYDETPLSNAAGNDNVTVVKMLLAHGAKVTSVDEDGDTPLTSCIKASGSPEITKILIQHGMDVDHRNKAGETALSLAKKAGWQKAIRLLKAGGALR